MKELEGRDITYYNAIEYCESRKVIENTLDSELLGYNISGLLIDVKEHAQVFGVKNKTLIITINLEGE
jgi:hypothetical protein